MGEAVCMKRPVYKGLRWAPKPVTATGGYVLRLSRTSPSACMGMLLHMLLARARRETVVTVTPRG